MSRGALITATVALAVFLGTLWVSVGTVGRERRGPVAGAAVLEGSDPARGPSLIATYGCGTCHTIEGLRGADGMVGPPLTDVARRGYIAGSLPTTPENLARWIHDPQGVEPGTAMPDTGIGRDDARDVAAYLYRLAGP